ncbi:hypothetical protein Godav_011225, partial [Gossypium davidsonii]|nr:hypothetical protein [Gossypium davidsonii]
ITDEEEEAWQLYRDSNLQQLDYDLCLVEFFLMASVVHFLAIQNMLANLWHPIRGVQISDRGEKRFLFRFYHKEIFQRNRDRMGYLTSSFKEKGHNNKERINKSGLEKISELLPRVEHRVCAKHLYANWRKENPGGDLQQAFWGVCKSYIATDFEDQIKKINLSNIVPMGVGVNYLKEGVPQVFHGDTTPEAVKLHLLTPPPAFFDLAPLALSQTVASEASASSPAPST